VLGAIAAVPAAAPAAVPRDFFGVTVPLVGTDPVSVQSMKNLKGAKVGTARVQMYWAMVENTKGAAYDWSYYDDLVGRAADAGMRVLPVLEGTPNWFASTTHYPPMSSEGRAAFAKFVRAAVDRYGRDGDFWKQRGDLPRREVAAWQVWNEPNLAYWWNETPNARQYLTLLRTVSKAIRAGDAKADVVLGGLPETHGIPMNKYLDQLYRASKTTKQLFDVIAIHPYARGWAGVEGALYRVREVTRRYKDDKTPIMVTEIGWATGGGKDLDFQVTSPAGQASRLKSTFGNLVKTRKKWNVSGVVWYALHDFAPFDWWIYNCGLFDRNGKAKPAWQEFRRFTRATVATR
jgi:arabinogalactan endo-1,4-beta-galactosidase